MYTIDGRKVEVRFILDNGSVAVSYYYESYNGELILDDHIEIVGRVFNEPPKQVIHGNIESLNKEIDNLFKKRNSLSKEVLMLERSTRDRIEKLKKYDALKYIEDFVEGKITHYVVITGWRSPEIISLKETVEGSDGYRLLSLFGFSNGDLTWKLNTYRDHSGCDYTVVPCTSYEMAVDTVKKNIYDEYKKTGNTSSSVIEMAEKHNIELPDGYKEKFKDEKIKKITEDINKHHIALMNCENQLKEIQG